MLNNNLLKKDTIKKKIILIYVLMYLLHIFFKTFNFKYYSYVKYLF